MSLILYIAIMAGVTYLIRVVPFTVFRKKIQNHFLQSFLYYIPYAVLSAMTIPAIFYSTGNVITAAVEQSSQFYWRTEPAPDRGGSGGPRQRLSLQDFLYDTSPHMQKVICMWGLANIHTNQFSK
ncbi:MAG: AzlD domain-containing protein [Ruminococcus callidus]